MMKSGHEEINDSLALSINLYFILVIHVYPTHNSCNYFRTHLVWKSREDKGI